MLLAICLIAVPAGFFPDRAFAQTYTFSNVDINGNIRVDGATILTYAGIGKGQPVTASELNDAYQRVAGTGLFETVELVPSGNTLKINVQEFPTINVISFEGNKRLKDEMLQGLIQSQSRRVYSPSMAEADSQIIADAYRQSGRIAAVVQPKIIRRSENRVDLVFEISEGQVSEIERLSFVGNRSYSDGRLRRVLATKQAGLLHRVFSNDTLIEDRIAYDRQLLTDFYNSRGFIDFQVLSVSSELDRNRRGFILTFNLREGQRFRIGEVSVASDLPEVDAQKFLRAAKLRKGAIYSPVPIDTDVARMERLAVQEGLQFIQIEPRITRNDRGLTVNVTYVISKGPRVFVERIDIEGNVTTLDQVIRRQFDLVEGDPFNPRMVREGADRIRALGFFKDADVQTREGTSSDEVIIDVNVEEQPTGSLGFGGTYSTNDGLGVSITFSERNFLGRGQGLSATIAATSSSQNLAFSFNEPAFLGRDVNFGLNAFYRTTEDDNSDYSTDRGLFQPSFSFPITEQSRFGLRVGVQYGKVHGVDDRSSDILRVEQEMGGLTSVLAGYTLSYNTLRSSLDPTSGFQASFSQDFGYRSDSATWVETEASLRAKKAIWNEQVNLRAELEGGALNYFGGDSLIVDRFSLSNKIRGFKSNGVGPRDLNVENEDVLNGNYYAVARFETDFPLGLPEEYGILGGLFWDIGSVWDLNNINGGPDGQDPVDDAFHLRSAAGISIFWDTAVGPLRFNFSRPILKEDYDQEQNFEFTVSTRF
ncbi:outer membrane protein assembly factor BamA [Tropicimonas sp. IMCC34043]|uniref:outer membrane protein assembly factor BamA n=1 Tax=Tropicimonas sp. IMCC34043 TaxID=2248760 RepID=UPI000E233B0B|nr:outer membrane protein assembly factor BamA [Tropicimonas sp. IMCC34043]